MAENKITSFTIEEAIDVGDKDLLESIVSDEVSANPEDIRKIDEEGKKEDKTNKKEPTKSKAEVPPKEEHEEDETLDELIFGKEEEQKEEEEEEEEEPVKAKEPAKKSTKEEPSIFRSLAKDLFKFNIFTKDDDEEDVEINTPEEFLERFNYEKKKGAIQTIENFISQFGQEYQEAFNAIFVKGVNPREYFTTYNEIQDLSKLDLTVESNQISVVKKALLEQGFEPEDVEAEIERLRTYGDLENVANRHYKVLLKREKAKLDELSAKKEEELRQKEIAKQHYERNVKSILQEKLKTREFDGIPLNPKLANELQDFLLVERYRTPSGETLTEFDRAILELKRPENHEKKVKVALLLKIMEKDPTLSTLQKSGVSKKTDSLFGEVIRTVKSSKSGSSASSFFDE